LLHMAERRARNESCSLAVCGSLQERSGSQSLQRQIYRGLGGPASDLLLKIL
jgi:hypothetical protein